MDGEAKFEAAAKAFLLGLFSGQSRVEIEEIQPAGPYQNRKFVIRLFAPDGVDETAAGG